MLENTENPMYYTDRFNTPLPDSGARREFETGAVRDIAEGKGRCDLLPLHIFGNYSGDTYLLRIADFMKFGDPIYLWDCACDFIGEFFGDNRATAWLELAKHYEDGAKKYSERNWEKGIPLHCYIDSAIRHYLKLRRGDKDERHDRAFLWNLYGCMWTLRYHPEMNDLPFATEKNFKEEKNSDLDHN